LHLYGIHLYIYIYKRGSTFIYVGIATLIQISFLSLFPLYKEDASVALSNSTSLISTRLSVLIFEKNNIKSAYFNVCPDCPEVKRLDTGCFANDIYFRSDSSLDLFEVEIHVSM
jgi:hypothetical protein